MNERNRRARAIGRVIVLLPKEERGPDDMWTRAVRRWMCGGVGLVSLLASHARSGSAYILVCNSVTHFGPFSGRRSLPRDNQPVFRGAEPSTVRASTGGRFIAFVGC